MAFNLLLRPDRFIKSLSLQLVKPIELEKLRVWIGHRFLRREKISAENFTVTMHQITVVLLQELLALGPVIGGQQVPRHARFEMVREVKIIIEEHQRQQRRRFHHDSALA